MTLVGLKMKLDNACVWVNISNDHCLNYAIFSALLKLTHRAHKTTLFKEKGGSIYLFRMLNHTPQS
jgi:hypothetical protein